MAIRWTRLANDDFAGIVSWIAASNPAAAAAVGRRILSTVEQLEKFPLLGKPGRSPDTRESLVPGLPYVVVYVVERAPVQSVVILRVLHGAMSWPPVKE